MVERNLMPVYLPVFGPKNQEKSKSCHVRFSKSYIAQFRPSSWSCFSRNFPSKMAYLFEISSKLAMKLKLL